MTVASTVHSSYSYSFCSGSFSEPSAREDMKICVRVVPNAGKFRISSNSGGWKIYVKEKAEGNKANAAVIKGLEKLLGKGVRLISGATARKKVLEIEGKEKEVLDALRKAGTGKGA
ncbi:hypothetical protein GF415_04445 [Candidatus Micrarchaeota archaeon]|nr:hypothetical protein [Candidatus Micrarchaeota archaeon]